jgi:hypothetical protein
MMEGRAFDLILFFSGDDWGRAGRSLSFLEIGQLYFIRHSDQLCPRTPPAMFYPDVESVISEVRDSASGHFLVLTRGHSVTTRSFCSGRRMTNRKYLWNEHLQKCIKTKDFNYL